MNSQKSYDKTNEYNLSIKIRNILFVFLSIQFLQFRLNQKKKKKKKKLQELLNFFSASIYR